MKNILLVAFFLLTSNLSVFSQEVLLSLSTRYIDPADVGGSGPASGHRSPVYIPDIVMSDRVITLNGAFQGYCMCIVDDNEDVVFSCIIEEQCNAVTIPSYIQGTFELQFIQGNICCYCDIELN